MYSKENTCKSSMEHVPGVFYKQKYINYKGNNSFTCFKQQTKLNIHLVYTYMVQMMYFSIKIHECTDVYLIYLCLNDILCLILHISFHFLDPRHAFLCFNVWKRHILTISHERKELKTNQTPRLKALELSIQKTCLFLDLRSK